MKRRIISAVLVLILLLGGFQTFVYAEDEKDALLPYLLIGETVIDADERVHLKGSNTLPSYYSSADLGYVSSIDDQQTTDICWAFTHNELIETYVAKTTGQKINLSEQTMKFETSNVTNPEYGYGRTPNEGGNEIISTAYIAREGVSLEKDEPFSISETRLVNPSLLPKYGTLESVPMLDDGKEGYDAKRVETIKKLVLEYGAVGTGVYFDRSSLYLGEDKSCYYYNGEMASPDHEMTIVGWDDNYSKDNFAITPEGDGAYIVKNSWGNYHNNNTTDLVYISYYDKFVNTQVFATSFDMSSKGYDYLYQFDPLGWASNGYFESNQVIYATKYTKKSEKESINAVSTYVSEAGSKVEVYVNLLNGDVADKSKYVKVYSEIFEFAGYYRMEFDSLPIIGKEFSVAIRVESPNDQGITYFPIQTNVGTFIKNSKAYENTCFVSSVDFDSLTPIENFTYFKSAKSMLAMKAFTTEGEFETIDSSLIFKDISSTAWYKSYTDYSVTMGLFQGTSENTFSPNMSMTRAQFVQVLGNISGIDTENEFEQEKVFDDVSPDAWYAPAVKWAYECEIVSGTGEGLFSPNESVTREQMCVMLVSYIENFLQETAVSSNVQFADHSDISSWAAESVYKCFGEGLISGVGGNRFEPKITANRSVGATIFTDFHKQYFL